MTRQRSLGRDVANNDDGLSDDAAEKASAASGADVILAAAGAGSSPSLLSDDPDNVFTSVPEFYEKHLDTGSDPNPGMLTQTIGVMVGYEPYAQEWETDGNGVPVYPGTYGYLSWNASSKTLSYTLTEAPFNRGEAYEFEEFSGIPLTNADNEVLLGDLTIDIYDDSPAPSLSSSQEEISPGDIFEAQIHMVYGADGESVISPPALTFTDEAGESRMVRLEEGEAISGEPLIIDKVTYGILSISADGKISLDTTDTQAAGKSLSIMLSIGDSDGSEYVDSEVYTFRIAGGDNPEPGEEPNPMPDTPVFYEHHLEKGTEPDNAKLTQEISLPEGTIPDVTDWAQSGSLHTFQGTYGVLTWDTSGNKLTYTLTTAAQNGLAETVTADSVVDEFSTFKVISDSSPTAYERPFSITIHDDAPLCSLKPAATNIMPGETLSGTWELNFGADEQHGDILPTIEIINAEGKSSGPISVNSQENFTTYVNIEGVYYGFLSLTNGNFTFNTTRSPVTEDTIKIIMTATDGDGDVGSDSFTVTVGENTDPGPEPEPMPEQPEFYEKHLSSGTEADPAMVMQQLDLPAGCTPDLSGWNTDGDISTLDGEFGTLTWNAGTNTLTYTLTKAAANGAPGEANDASLVEEFANFKVLNTSGASFERPLSITIHDDAPAPVFTADTTIISGSETAPIPLTGQLAVNFGADGPAQTKSAILTLTLHALDASVEIDLATGSNFEIKREDVLLGKLTLADGEYTFVPTPALTGQVDFELTVTDADGDTKTESFRVEAQASVLPPVAIDAFTLHESALDSGSAPDAEAFSKIIELPQGSSVDTNSGDWQTMADGGYLHTGHGYEHLTISYSPDSNSITCRLNDAITHSGEEAEVSGPQQVNLTLVTESGPVEAYFTVSVADDAPVTGQVTGGEGEAGRAISGTVVFAFGADGPAEGALVLNVVEAGTNEIFSVDITLGEATVIKNEAGTELGTFTLGDDGNYVFTGASNMSQELTFSLTLTDSDGDRATSDPFTVTVRTPDPFEVSLELNEAYALGGTRYEGKPVLTSIELPDGYTVDTSDWTDLGNWGGAQGVYEYLVAGAIYLRYDGTSLLCYQVEPIGHTGPGADRAVLDTHEITLLDADNNPRPLFLDLTIIDDVPLADLAADKESVTSDGSEDSIITGSLTALVGADGNSTGSQLTVVSEMLNDTATLDLTSYEPQEVSIAGQLVGVFQLSADGSFTFKPATGLDDSLGFDLSLTDSDGDPASAHLALEIKPAGTPPSIDPVEISLDEAGLANGTNPNASVSELIPLPAGSYIDTDVAGGLNWQENEDGSLTCSPYSNVQLTYQKETGSLLCTLTGPIEHQVEGRDSLTLDDLSLPLKLADGTDTALVVKLTVIDDVPVADFTADKESVTSDGSEDSIITGSLTALVGADGNSTGSQLTVVSEMLNDTATLDLTSYEPQEVNIAGQLVGVFQLSADGSFTFKPATGLDDWLGFDLSLTDSDADRASGHIGLEIKPVGTPPPIDPVEISLDEAGLANGTNPNASVSELIPLPAGSHIDTDAAGGLNWQENEDGSLTCSPYSSIQLTYQKETGSLLCTLTGPIEHQVEGRDSLTLDDLSLPLKLADGTDSALVVKLTVIDDVPQSDFTADKEAVTSDGSDQSILTGSLGINYGADGQNPNEVPFLSIRSDTYNNSMGLSLREPGEYEIKLGSGEVVGQFTLAADGSYTFIPVEGLEDTLHFELTFGDSEGDFVKDSITLTVVSGDTPPVPSYEFTFDEANLAEGTNTDISALTKELQLPDGTFINTSGDGWTPAPDGHYVKTIDDALELAYDSASNTLSCALLGPLTHQTQGRDTLDLGDLGLLLVDADGQDLGALQLKITVTDDMPELVFTTEQETMSGQGGVPAPLVGVFQFAAGADADPAADNAPLLTIHAHEQNITFSGSLSDFMNQEGQVEVEGVVLGTLQIADNGQFTFTPAATLLGQVDFNLSYTDTDGDKAEQSFSVTAVGGTTPLGPLEIAFDEGKMPDGNDPLTGVSVTVKNPTDGALVTTGWESDDQITFVLQNEFVRYEYNANSDSFTFTLLAPYASPEAGSAANMVEGPALEFLSETSGTLSVPVQFTITEDRPELYIEEPEAVQIGQSVEHMFYLSYGADGEAANDALLLDVRFPNGETASLPVVLGESLTIEHGGQFYGSFIFTNGTYSFSTADATASGTLQFTLSATDSDGDRVSEDFSLTIAGTLPPAIDPIAMDFEEAHLANGTDPTPGQLVKTSVLPEGYRVDTSGEGWTGQADGSHTFEGACGTLSVSADGRTISYTFEKALEHGTAVSAKDPGINMITVLDADNQPYELPVSISITDDVAVPQIGLVDNTILHSGEAFENTWSVIYGADGKPDALETTVEFIVRIGAESATYAVRDGATYEVIINDINYGRLSFTADTYTFYAAPNISSSAELYFDLAAYDGDGDRSIKQATAPSVILMAAPGPGPLPDLSFEIFQESALPYGSSPNPDALTQTIQLGDFTIQTDADWVYGMGNNIYIKQVSGGHLIYDATNNTLSFELQEALAHQDAATLDIKTPIVLLDPDNNPYETPITITVADDSPSVEIRNDNIEVEAGEFAEGALDIEPGADFDLSDRALTFTLRYGLPDGSTADVEITVPLNGDAAPTVNTNLFSFSFMYNAQTGRVEYVSQNIAGERGDREVFEIIYSDNDGSQATADFTQTITGGDIPPPQGDYNSNAVFNPGYDEASLFGSFQTSATSIREGWSSGNAAWVSVLPSGLLPFPSDPALEGMTDGRAIRLQSSAMTANNVDKFIGTENSIVGILDDLGIETNSLYVNDDRTSRLALTSKEFSSEGGEIVFNWSFSGRAWAGESDAAFWILMDENNNIIDSGKIVHLQNAENAVQYENGITRIPVPYTAEESGYKLVIGSVDGGSANNASARLYVETAVIQEGKYLFSGNIYSEIELSGGEIPDMSESYIDSVTLENGSTINFGSGETVVTVELDAGLLTLNRETGDYKFVTYDGKPAPLSTQIIYEVTTWWHASYTITQNINIDPPTAHDNVATQEAGYEVDRLGSFECTNAVLALDGNGWSRYGNIYTGRGLIHADTLPVPTNDLIDANSTGPNAWVRLRAATNLSNTAREAVFGTKDSAEIKAILNEIGIEGDNFGYRSTSTGIDAALIQKTFSSSGGTINFGWSFYTGEEEDDAGFWMLKDSQGNIVQSGVLHQGPGKSNGMVSIDIDPSASSEEYTLVLGALNVGQTTGLDPLLYVSNILHLEGGYDFRGNVITDAGPDGLVDFVYEDTKLASFTYDGETRYFDENTTQLVFETPGGVLTVDWNGNYQFKAEGEVGTVAEEFSYTLVGADKDNSGTLIVQQTGPKVFAQTPDLVLSGESEALAEFNTSLAKSGWVRNSGSILSNVKLPSSFETPPDSEVLEPYSDSQYLRITGSSAMPAQQWALLLGEADGHLALGNFLSEIGASGDVWRSYAPKGAFASSSFESTGGQIVFDWSFGGRAQADKDYDSSFWILKDSSGKVVQSGLLSQLLTDSTRAVYEYDSGVCSIDIPYTADSEVYTLTLGTIQMGNMEYSQSYLYVGTVVHVPQTVIFSGNLLEDASAQGQYNMLNAEAVLISVEYNGKTYAFADEATLSITTDDGGMLTVANDGSYAFKHPDGSQASVAEDFSYTVKDVSGQTDSAALHLRSDDHKYLDDDLQATGLDGTPGYVESTGSGVNLIGGWGEDVIVASDKGDSIWSNPGDDIIYGGAGSDAIDSGVGNDTVFGGGGNDSIFGYTGDDLIYGGSGNNTLTGGDGADTFGWKHVTDLSGTDSITDFSLQQGDKLLFSDLLSEADTLQGYLDDHVANLNLQTSSDSDTLSFDIKVGGFSKEVNITLNPNDASYSEFRSAYLDADNQDTQQAVLEQLLLNISC